MKWSNPTCDRSIGLPRSFCSHPIKEYSGEYSDQGRHYKAESNSDLRVFGDPLLIAENVVDTSARGCQLRPLDKL